MANKRILDETTASVAASDDYLYIDGQTNGSRKITPENIVLNSTTAQLLAQHIADATQEVTDIQGDISDLQGDLADVKADLGDLEDLETTDKSNLVAAINEAASSGGGLTEDVKQALLDCFANVAWTTEDGQEYYDALEDALYPPADLVSISAVYTQGGTVYDNQTLDSLKTDLVVTAHMSDSTTQTVTTYTLSGTLATGTSTITVAYGGKITIFTVTVTHATTQYTITNTLTNCTNSNSATVINEETAYSGTLTATSGNVMSTVAITMGGTDITSTAYNSETGAISIASVTGNVVITAEAVEDVGWISGVPYDIVTGGMEDMYLNSGTETEYTGRRISPYLPCVGAWFKSDKEFYRNYVGKYDSENAFIANTLYDTIYADMYMNYDDKGAITFRVSGDNTKMTSAVITPYTLPEITETTVWQEGQYYWASLENVGDISDGGVIQPNQTGRRYSNFLNCYNATTITDNWNGHQGMWCRYAFYDSNKEFISITTFAIGATDRVVTLPEGTRYFRLVRAATDFGVCFTLSREESA